MEPADNQASVETHDGQSGRTLIELRQRKDGSWSATQQDADVEGTGETGALAAMEYCRKIAKQEQ